MLKGKTTITHFWNYYSTIYYKTHPESEFEKFNLEMLVFFDKDNQQIQKDLLSQQFSDKDQAYIKKNIEIIKDYKNIYGSTVVGLRFNPYTGKYYNSFNRLLKETGIVQYGQNITKYNIITDPGIEIDNSNRKIWFLDIEIDNFSRNVESEEDITEESLQFDKTVEEQKFPIISITVYDSIEKMYYQFILKPTKQTDYIKKLKSNALFFHDNSENKVFMLFDKEETLLQEFSRFMKRAKPEIISGWYSNDFDMPYIINRLYKLSYKFDNLDERHFTLIEEIGCMTKRSYSNERSWNNQMPGVELIDYMQIYKKFQQQTPQSFGLDYVQKYEGIEGKTEKKGFMKYNSNFKEFINYIFKDVEILEELERKNSILKMLLQLQETAKMPLSKMIHMSFTVEQMIYHKSINNGLVFQSSVSETVENTSFQGAIVLEPEDKFFSNVIVLDYESLYPNIIRTFNISPETLLINDQVDYYDSHKKPYIEFTSIYNNQDTMTSTDIKRIGYQLDKIGLIPQTVDMLISERLKYKKLYKEQKDDDPKKQEYFLKQWNFKIVLNSIYGVMGFKFSPLFNIKIAESITQGQRHMLKFQIDKLKEHNTIIYGDTDSIFFNNIDIQNMGTEYDVKDAQKKEKDYVNNCILKELKVLFKNIKDNQYNNYLKTDVDKIFKKVRFFGVKKRYYGIGFDNKEIMQGVELVRTDTPEFQKELLTELFKKQLQEEIKNEHILNQYEVIKSAKNYIQLGETKSISKNNYEQYKIIPYHVRGLLFQKKIGLQVPDYITDKLLILPVKIYRDKNPEMFEEQKKIFKFSKKKSSIESINVSCPMDKIDNLIQLLTQLNYVKIDFSEIFDKHILKKLEQFSNLHPMIEIIRKELEQVELTEGLTLFKGVEK